MLFFHFQAVSVAIHGTDQSPEKSKERFPLISVGFVWSLSQFQCHPIETNLKKKIRKRSNVWMLITAGFIWQMSASLFLFLSNHKSSALFSYCVRISYFLAVFVYYVNT